MTRKYKDSDFGGMANIILYVGGLYILYSVLKSWDIIS